MKWKTQMLNEGKNKPTNKKLWSKAKSLARSKFDVYPSAYANGWAAKWYKKHGGGWLSESTINERHMTDAEKIKEKHLHKKMAKAKGSFEKQYPGRGEDVFYATTKKMAMEQNESLKELYKESLLDSISRGALSGAASNQEDDIVKSAAKGAAGAAGSAAGESIGSEAGAAIGTAIAPGVGTAIGAVLGGLAGSQIGGQLASSAVDTASPTRNNMAMREAYDRAKAIIKEEVVNKSNKGTMTEKERAKRDRIAKTVKGIKPIKGRPDSEKEARFRYATYLVLRERGGKGKSEQKSLSKKSKAKKKKNKK